MTNDACGGEMTRKLMTKNDVDDILIIILPYHVDVSSLPVKENIIGPTVDNRAEREKRTVRKPKKTTIPLSDDISSFRIPCL